MRRIFYCPIQFRRYHGIAPEDLKHEDLEDWEYDEMEDTEAFGEIAQAEVQRLAREIQGIRALPKGLGFSTEVFDSRIWLKAEVQAPAGVTEDALRETLALAIADGALNCGAYADGEDSVLAAFSPYEAFNQTSCAGPYYEENCILTEYEAMNRLLGPLDIHISPDFQCDQTGGFPTSLCVSWDKGKAWLALNESIIMDRDEMELEYYRDLCADFGVRSCYDEEGFNQILKSLGEDAYQTAYLPAAEEGEQYEHSF